VKILEPSGIGLGLEKGEVFRKKLKKIKDTFQPGDIFLLYTDGVTETFNEDGKAFGNERLVKILKNSSETSAKVLINRIEKDLENHRRKTKRIDDFTLIAVRTH